MCQMAYDSVVDNAGHEVGLADLRHDLGQYAQWRQERQSEEGADVSEY